MIGFSRANGPKPKVCVKPSSVTAQAMDAMQGRLYWSLNDVWPAVSWSTVDHAGRWKLGHYAARRANAPRTALWVRHREDSLCFQLFNDLPDQADGALEVAVKDFEGRVVHETSVPAKPRQGVPSWSTLATWRFGARLPTRPTSAGPGRTLLKEVHGRPPPRCGALPSRPYSIPIVQCTPPVEDGHELTTDVYVPMVQLTADVPGHWSNNGMALEPGQSCVVQFTPEGSVAHRRT